MVNELHRSEKMRVEAILGLRRVRRQRTRLPTRFEERVEAFNSDEMMEISKVDVDVRMSDRMTKKAEVLGFQIKVVRYTATCEPFHAGLEGPCRGPTIGQSLLSNTLVHSSFVLLLLHDGVSLIDGRL
jgi:hypothetical protein